MSLSLKITSYQRLTPSQQSVYQPTSDSFTIGRNSDNDWAIPDPQRFLSGKHCRIDKHGDRYTITDTSTNGVFLNGSEQRLERNQSVDLNPGDNFRIGDYEFEVLIDDEAMAGNPFTSDDETMIGTDPFDDPFSAPAEASPKPDSFDDEDDFDDDPFADDDSFGDDKDHDDEDFLQEADESLAHLGDSPLGKEVSLDALMGFDDDEDEEEDPESIDDIEDRRSPLHEAFKPSSVIEPTPAPVSPQTPVDDGFSAAADDIPDNWDEATGMFILPEKPVTSEPSEVLDDFPDDWDVTTGILKADLERKPETPEPAPPKPEPVAPEPPKPEPPRPEPPRPEPPAAAPPVQPAAPPARPEPAPTPAAATPQAAPVAASGDAIAAFARGAGLEMSQLSGVNQDALFEQVGRMLVNFTEGLIQTLGGRTHIKSEFRLDQTMIRPAENNPFKFSTSKTRTLMQLLSKDDPAYMTGVNAITEGFDDVNAHQMAVVAGMEAALQDILQRFNPKALETRIVSDSILDNILPGGKKAKYWDIFKLLFDEIAGEAEDNFQQLFGKEFTRAYEAQLDRLKNIRKESR